jgi:hypothetical protein
MRCNLCRADIPLFLDFPQVIALRLNCLNTHRIIRQILLGPSTLVNVLCLLRTVIDICIIPIPRQFRMVERIRSTC